MRLTTDGPRAASLVLLDRRVHWATAWTAVVTALALTFILDRRTGSAPVQHLYYLPIIFAGIRFGRRASLAAAALAVGLYHAANPHVLTFRYEELDVVQMALFVAVGLVSAKLAGDARRLRRLATTDDLTGLHNLRSFDARLRLLVRAARPDAPLALLVLDLDRLKSLNDAHGHLAGAGAVRAVGQILAARLPPDAVACRYGGDEFVVALPRCTDANARAVADDLRRAVHAASPVLAGVPFPAGTLSISVGAACGWRRLSAAPADPAAEDAAGEQLFRAADAALYAAKAAGRNRVAGATPFPRD